MQHEKGDQLSLRFWQFHFAGFVLEFHPQPVRRRTQRIALGLHSFSDDESLAFERSQHFIGERKLFHQIHRRKRTGFEHTQDLSHRIFRTGIEEQLAARVTSPVGQLVNFA